MVALRMSRPLHRSFFLEAAASDGVFGWSLRQATLQCSAAGALGRLRRRPASGADRLSADAIALAGRVVAFANPPGRLVGLAIADRHRKRVAHQDVDIAAGQAVEKGT